jgi:hypothetical protein
MMIKFCSGETLSLLTKEDGKEKVEALVEDVEVGLKILKERVFGELEMEHKLTYVRTLGSLLVLHVNWQLHDAIFLLVRRETLLVQ